jgi:hypothetical protein
MIIRAKQNRLFKRIHDGFIMGNEIVLGKDYSTGVEREDLPDYYEEVQDPDAPTPPEITGSGVIVPSQFLWAFPNDKFILHGTGFEIPLAQTSQGKAVDTAYLEWPAFLAEIWKPEHQTVFDILEPVWLYCEQQADARNFVQLI